jgi:hypothetical protein
LEKVREFYSNLVPPRGSFCGGRFGKPPVVIAMRVNVEAETTQAGLKEILETRLRRKSWDSLLRKIGECEERLATVIALRNAYIGSER